VSADPTAANRKAVGNFITGLLPTNSPLKKSIEASKAEERVRELEAQAQQERAIAAEQKAAEEAAMMSVGQPARAEPLADRALASQDIQPRPADLSSSTAPTDIPSQSLPQGLALEAKAQEQLGKDQAALLQAQQSELAARDAEAQAIREQKAAEVQDQISKINSMKIEPKSFWQGKSTGQKIAAGIGLFFASITPQGAQNAIKIIDDEIERDLVAQKANLSKEQNTLSALEKQLGSADAAATAFRIKSLQMLDLKLKQAEAQARGPLARAKAVQGQDMIAAQLAQKQAELQAKLQEKQEKLAEREFEFEGFKVRAGSTREAAQLKQYASNAADVLGDIEKLKAKTRLGSVLSKEDRTKTQTILRGIRGKLQGQFTPKDLDKLIPDPTGFTTFNAQTLKSLETLRQDVLGSLENRLAPSLVKESADPFKKYRVK